MLNSKHDAICTLSRAPVFMDLPPTASAWRRAARRLRWLALPCEWHHASAANLRSRRNLLLERRRQLATGHWLIWHPYSQLKYYWDCFVATLMFLQFIYMPFQVFVICPNPRDPFILLGDAVAFMDIAATFVTGYTDEDSKRVELRAHRIAARYLRRGFWPELMAALPLQLYQMFDKCKLPTNTAMFVFKLPRLVSMERKWNNIHEQLKLSYITTVLLLVVFRMILFFHWMTYVHYQVPAICSHYYTMNRSWMQRFRGVQLPHNTVFKKYTANLYLACGLCIGAGYYTPIGIYVIPELLLTSFIGLMGLIFLLYCFTTLLRLMMYNQYESFLYHGKLRELEEYMELKRLPGMLQKKVLLFLKYEFNGGYFNEPLILSTINEQMKQDINMHCCRKLVANVPVFSDMPVALLNTIVFSLNRVLYMPGETVVRSGEPLTRMYLICSGTVAVLNWAGKEIAHLKDGAFYGEAALAGPALAPGITIIALEITEIYTLRSDQFQSCVAPYPHLRRRLAALRPRAQPPPPPLPSPSLPPSTPPPTPSSSPPQH